MAQIGSKSESERTNGHAESAVESAVAASPALLMTVYRQILEIFLGQSIYGNGVPPLAENVIQKNGGNGGDMRSKRNFVAR